MTLNDCADGDIVLLGSNRSYAIGDTAYMVHREAGYYNGQYTGTYFYYVWLSPVTYMDDKFVRTQLAKGVVKEWSDVCTIIEREPSQSFE